jgi:hypothetical protein
MDAENIPLVVICRICGDPVTIGTCTVDDDGRAVHEECYGKELLNRSNTSVIFPPKDENEGTGMASS